MYELLFWMRIFLCLGRLWFTLLHGVYSKPHVRFPAVFTMRAGWGRDQGDRPG